MKSSEIRPALPARIAAWGIVFLLTIALTVSALSFPAAANRVLTSEELHSATATDKSIIREQMETVNGKIQDMADDYAFSAEAVISELQADVFTDINRKTAEWWTNILSKDHSDDNLTEIPMWTADEKITNAIYNTLNKQIIPEESERAETAKGITSEIEKAVNRTVMPFRKALLTLAVRYSSRKTDVAGIIRFVSQIPRITAAASLLLAGIIALLLGKNIRYSLKYYGAAFAGAGISALTGIILLKNADFTGMLREASEGLNHQVETMMKTSVTETWILAAVLTVAGFVCLICYIREPVQPGKHGGMHEKKKDNMPDSVATDPGTGELRYRRRSAQRTV